MIKEEFKVMSKKCFYDFFKDMSKEELIDEMYELMQDIIQMDSNIEDTHNYVVGLYNNNLINYFTLDKILDCLHKEL